jgi:hypothetical protein
LVLKTDSSFHDGVRQAVKEHSIALNAIANFARTDREELSRRTEELLLSAGPIACALDAAVNDHDLATLISAAARVAVGTGSVESNGNPLATSLAVASISDPLVRDVAFLHFWRGLAVERVMEIQGLRSLTVRQNVRRFERLLDRAPQGWRCPPEMPAADEAETLAALKGDTRSTYAAQCAATDALAAAARQSAQQVDVLIGPRSVRPVRGRPLLATSPRPSPGVAEAHAEYGQRSFVVGGIGWGVRVVPYAQGINFALMDSDAGVVILLGGSRVGAISPANPALALPGITLPAEVTFRKVGKLA